MASCAAPAGTLDANGTTPAKDYADYLDCLTCEREKAKSTSRDLITGIFGVAMGLYLSKKAYDRYKAATDKLKEIADRQQAMAFTLKDHYLSVTHPQKMLAVDATLGYPIPTLSCDSAFSRFRSMLTDVSNQAREWRSRMLAQYCIDAPSCAGREIGVAQAVATANAGYASYQHGRRRRDKHVPRKAALVQRAHAASYSSPSPIFGLMNDATQTYSSIFQNSNNNLAGGLSLIGSGISNIFGSWTSS